MSGTLRPLRHILSENLEKLRASEVPAPERESRKIAAWALGAETVTGRDSDPVSADAEKRIADAVARRCAGAPLSHIVGYRDFWKHRFRVTPDVLDPRPETETLVELALAQPFSRVLDLGTGSGCILISLLDERPEARGVGTDVSERAVLIAGENAARIGVADRLILPLSDWFEDIGGQYDLIVSNPPYIAASEMPSLSREVREHEPRGALTDEGDGLDAYRAIAKHAPRHLEPNGRLLVEIGATQGADVSAIFAACGLREVAVHQDLDHRDRVVAARAPAAISSG